MFDIKNGVLKECRCDSLKQITVPDSVTKIGDWAFSRCGSLTQITIPDSVTKIGDCAFKDCKSLTQITIPDSVTQIGNHAFFGCKSLKTIDVDANNKKFSSIEGNIYSKDKTILLHCASAKQQIKIPNSVTQIGDSAFSNCESLTQITIPDSVTQIGHNAFHRCKSLVYNVANNVRYLGNDKNKYYAAVGFNDKNIDSIILHPNCKIISNHAFSCSSLTQITIPDGVAQIGDNAFGWCASLTQITIPDGVAQIGDNAFEYCRSLTQITIPDSVTQIGDSAFLGCNSLTQITIPNSVTKIGDCAFSCSSLKRVTILGTPKITDSTFCKKLDINEEFFCTTANLSAPFANVFKKLTAKAFAFIFAFQSGKEWENALEKWMPKLKTAKILAAFLTIVNTQKLTDDQYKKLVAKIADFINSQNIPVDDVVAFAEGITDEDKRNIFVTDKKILCILLNAI